MPTSIISWLKQKIRERRLLKRQKNMPNQLLIQSVDGKEEYQVIQSDSPSDGKINIHWLLLDLHFSNVITIQREIFFIYELSKGISWSLSRSTGGNVNDKFYVTDEHFLKNSFHLSEKKITWFSLVFDSIIKVREEYCECYATVEEAYQMLFLRLEKNMGEIERKQYSDDEYFHNQTIDIGGLIEAKGDFFYPNIGCEVCGIRCYVKMKVTQQAPIWKIELESPDRRKATAILNNEYEVLNMFLEGRSLLSFLESRPFVNEEYYLIFKKLDILLEQRANHELEQPILTENDYKEFNRFVEEKFHGNLSQQPDFSIPKKPLIQVVESSQEERIIKWPKNNSNSNSSEIFIHRCQVKLFFPNGKRSRGEVISVYDLKTGMFWWTYELYIHESRFKNKIDDFLQRYYLYCSEDKITGFVLFPLSQIKPSIRFKESYERYDHFEEANAMLFSILEKNLDEIERGQTHNWFRKIPLWKYLAMDFIFFTNQIYHLMLISKITSVKRHNDNWQLRLESFKNRNATLILSNDYEVLEFFEEQ